MAHCPRNGDTMWCKRAVGHHSACTGKGILTRATARMNREDGTATRHLEQSHPETETEWRARGRGQGFRCARCASPADTRHRGKRGGLFL